MADLAAAIAKARKAGYSDAEIAAYIAKDPKMGPKVQTARKAGYSDAEIVAHVGKPNVVADVANSYIGGLKKGVASAADAVSAFTPFGVVNRAMSGSPGTVNMLNPFGSAIYSAVSKRAHKPQTTAGEIADTAGQMTPNAFAPGSAPARVANVVIPTATTEIAGRVAKASGASERGQQFARAGGALVGAGIASLRPQNIFARGQAPAPVERVAVRTRQDPAAMRARAQEFRSAGIPPTLTDVVDDTGRGAIRAAANRQTPGRQVANDFAEGRAENLPSRLSAQARRTMSRDPRTPDQIRAAETARRGANADRQFGAVRAQEVQLAPEGVQALRSDYGRAAIQEAARRERDPEVRAALNRLATAALDEPSTPITVGMADRVSRVLLGQAQEAARRGDMDLSATLGGLGRAVRTPTAQASPGYRAALDDYAADTRLVQAADVGENLMTANTDEFVAQAAALQPRERALALASGRRAIERRSGENVGSAVGVARRIANAPEQQQRNAALMGPERAQRLQQGARLEARAVTNAQDIAPSRGSSTFLNVEDGASLRQAAGAVGDVARGRWGNLLGRAYDAWRSRGMSDDQIEQLVRIATDPGQTDAAIQAIAARLQPAQRQEFLQLRQAALVGATGVATTAGSPAAAEERR